jgi:hypothetical protein
MRRVRIGKSIWLMLLLLPSDLLFCFVICQAGIGVWELEEMKASTYTHREQKRNYSLEKREKGALA